MFNFFKNIIKFKKIKKRQFNQQVIFIAHDAGKYFIFSEEERWKHLPSKTKNFKVDFEVSDDHKILKVNMHIDNKTYTLNVDTKTESATYFANFLESIWCFKDWDSLVYVSSTSNTNDFLCLTNIDKSTLIQRLMIMLDVKDKKEIIDICVDAQLFAKEFIQPLRECEPFKSVIEQAILLENYSPKKVRMPIY